MLVHVHAALVCRCISLHVGEKEEEIGERERDRRERGRELTFTGHVCTSSNTMS